MQHHYEGYWKGWALKIETFLGPEMARAKRVQFGPKKVETKAIKTTGTLVVLCTRVLLCSVVVCKRGGEVSLQLYSIV